jgi:hypothetical protein
MIREFCLQDLPKVGPSFLMQMLTISLFEFDLQYLQTLVFRKNHSFPAKSPDILVHLTDVNYEFL